MKTSRAAVAIALLAVLAATPAFAQQAGTATDQHHPSPPAAAPTTPPPMGPRGGDMPMMDMCRQMMGDMMGRGAPADPKERAEMLQMRGEMMKAMGDIMIRYARRMPGTTGK